MSGRRRAGHVFDERRRGRNAEGFRARADRRVTNGETAIPLRPIDDEQPRHVKGGVDLAADHRRNLGERIELLDGVDEPQQDDFLVVGGAEESTVDRRPERTTEAQARTGQRQHDRLHTTRARKDDFGDRAVRVGDDRIDDDGCRERDRRAKHVLREYVLDPEPDEDPETEHPMLDDCVAERYRRRDEQDVGRERQPEERRASLGRDAEALKRRHDQREQDGGNERERVAPEDEPNAPAFR